MPIASDDALDELVELGIDGRLTATDRDDRRTGLVHRLQTHLDRQSVLQLAGVAFDGTSDAGQIAGIERLQHQDTNG